MLRPALIGIITLLLLSGWGCGPSQPTGPTTEKLPPLKADNKPPTPKAMEPSPSPAQPVLDSGAADPPYNPIGRPDPFQPTTVAQEERGKDRKKALMPLEQFEVNDFELAAVISGPGMRMAMVQDPTGKGYFIQVGSRIGKKGGTVVSITDKEVIIEEPYRDFMGRKSSRKTTLKMYTRAAVPAPEEKK